MLAARDLSDRLLDELRTRKRDVLVDVVKPDERHERPTVADLRDRFDHAVAHPLASVAEHLDQVLQAALLAELDEGAVDLDLGQFAAMDELRVVIALDGGV